MGMKKNGFSGGGKRGSSNVQRRAGERDDILGAKHKHIQGPEVGERAGDAWGRPIGGGAVRSFLCPGDSGRHFRRWEAPKRPPPGLRLLQALHSLRSR